MPQHPAIALASALLSFFPAGGPVAAGIDLLLALHDLGSRRELPERARPPSLAELARRYDALAESWHERRLEGDEAAADLEALARLCHYAHLAARFHGLSSWLGPCSKALPSTPFAVCWRPRGAPVAAGAVEILVDREHLDLRPAPAFQAALFHVRRLKPGWRDLEKLRVTGIEAAGDRLRLLAGRSRYEHYLASHWAMANLPPSLCAPQWDALADRGLPRPVGPDSPFDNHLGVSALVVSSDGVVPLPRQARGNVASAGLVVPSASGSADWRYTYGAWPERPIHPAEDVARELSEELGVPSSAIRPPRVLALCRDMLRGGKPELFYLVEVDRRLEELRLGSEHEGTIRGHDALELPALDGSPGASLAWRRFLADDAFQLREVSPFTRALALLYLELRG